MSDMTNTVTDTDANANDERGLDYLTKLSYACVDRSDLSRQKKRDLLFSLYSFRCLFSDSELHRVSGTLVKYGCSFVTHSGEGEENVYEVTDKSGNRAFKFDAGSPLWIKRVKRGIITGEDAVLPQKRTLFEMAYETVTLSSANAELKSMWLVYFPYVFLIGAPMEHDIYDALKEVVMTAEVFSAANGARYADNICCTTAELSGEHPFVADWYRSFVEWKCEKNEKGISRETAKYQRALAMGDYGYAMYGTEKLLDSFPDDEEILLLNISARTSLAPTLELEARVKLLGETYAIIGDAFKEPLNKPAYFLYYRALTRLGMMDAEGAEADFDACLEIDPGFEPALLMKKGMEKAKASVDDLPPS